MDLETIDLSCTWLVAYDTVDATQDTLRKLLYRRRDIRPAQDG